ncbi:tail fiber domain-containing protein [Aquamicrobium lusatiense]|uniref:tail fiber domain-containing protein n=1 Tax=Aquamicrobium lusatiense TaxID=89772 RepID=UPI0024569198|nr:tail fiber domain-containing protein [Aquamicrobium lusatiense]MDH4991299.1 tail fiber domain-containing protein [Aquamicrobium lusatiense]
MVSTPKAPDPYETAAAQGGMNRDTAVSQQMLNMVDQYNPWGSVKYDQTGETTFTDSQGNIVTIPKFSQTTQYTPEQQAIFDASQAAQGNLANIASEQSAKIQQYLNEPFEFNNQDAEKWAYDLASSRILPQQQQNEAALRAQLINSGLRPGTAAWDSEMTRLTNANTDQLNQLALTGRQQAFSEALAQRNQPINEITALVSGSQVSNPAQMSGATPQTGVAGVDYTGLVNQQYQAELQQSRGMMGGLFGLGTALIGLSDRRAKENIRRVGYTDGGMPIYRFNYKGSKNTVMGVMAQDVEKTQPDAVINHPSGLKLVDYGKVH